MQKSVICLIVLLGGAYAHAQTPVAPAAAPDPLATIVDPWAQRVKKAKAGLEEASRKRTAAEKPLGPVDPAKPQAEIKRLLDEEAAARGELRREITNDKIAVVQYAVAKREMDANPNLFQLRSLLSELEQKRIDKQTGAGPSAAGTTSLVSKGSVPALLGLAVENGALTQSVSGTSVTFRGKPADIVKALAKKDYIQSAITPADDPLQRFLGALSYGITFDTKLGNTPGTFTGSRQQVTDFSFRYEVCNRRDPRHPMYREQWKMLTDALGTPLASNLANLTEALVNHPAYESWVEAATNAVAAASKDDVPRVLRSQMDIFSATVANEPAVAAAIRTASDSLDSFVAERRRIIDRIAKSAILTLEYENKRQENAAMDAGVMPMGKKIPSLSSATLIFARGFVGDAEFTMNATATFFNSEPVVSRASALRDFRVSGQFDVPLREIQKVGRPVLTFSGLFLSLRREPLGQKVEVNGTAVTAKGNVGVAQAKFSIPIKNSGFAIPLSVSWASRSEYLPDKKDVRGNFGITFDLDKLFARSQ